MNHWLQLGNPGRVESILAMRSYPEWAILTIASLLSALALVRRDPGYCWAYFVGFWSLYAGGFLLLFPFASKIMARLHGLPGMESWGPGGCALIAVGLVLQGTLVVQRHFWALALLALSSLSPIALILNAGYVLYLVHQERHVFT